MSPDREFFIPAETPAEAIARIYSLTGARDANTRGEKRALVALCRALRLGIPMARTSAFMAAEIARELRVDWIRSVHTDRNTVTLQGLNALLEGAADAYHAGSLRQLASNTPKRLSDPRWAAFQPARSKIEAVNRISALTGSGPEWLGPGSKEHKRVLVNLARALAPHLDPDLSKHRLASALANAFDVPWSESYESTGQSITLDGLNTILAGAELRLGRLGVDKALLLGTPEEEGKALAAALVDGWRTERQEDGSKRVVWDGRRTCLWMKREGLTRGPNDNEWQGFYWEEKGRQILNRAFTPNPNPPRSTYANTPFDYSLRFVWDLKAHTEAWLMPSTGGVRPGQAAAPLNDQQAMDECIADQGLGFLMLGGRAVADEDGGFVEWHRQFKAANGVKSKSSNSGKSRLRKASFEPLHVEAYWFPNTLALDAAKAAGQITGFAQGKQAPRVEGAEGSTRPPKYNLSVPKSRGTSLAVARFDWPRKEA